MKTKNISFSKKIRLTGLLLISLASAVEVYSWYPAVHDWRVLYSPAGRTALILFSAVSLAALFLVFLRWLAPQLMETTTRLLLPRRSWLHWLAAVGLTLIFAWIFLFSPWGIDFPGAWSRYLIALAFACLIAFVLNGLKNGIGWSEIILALSLFLYTASVTEIRAFYLAELASRSAILIEGLIVLGIIYLEYSEAASSLGKRLLDWRFSLGRSHRLILAIVVLGPFILRLLAGPSFYWFNPSLRFALVVVLSSLAAFLLISKPDQYISLDSALLGTGLVLLITVMVNDLYLASNYPFSLTWSEGNRFYDYSMIFGQRIYNASLPISNPYTYGAPGRYVLWGLPFLLPGLSIWFHRLWGGVLLIAPPVLFAWLATRPVREDYLRYILALWISLFFIVLTPVYAPILLSAVIVLFTAFDSSLLKRTPLVIIAGLYAGLSRWTWFLAPAAWAVLADLLFHYPQRKSSFIRKILPTALLGSFGLIAGFLVGQRNLARYAASESAVNTQPLLWYRLFPNQTYSLGIILGALIVTGPLLIMLVWWMISRRWKLDWIQSLAGGVSLAGFLGAGLVVSTKIGGGGDLHNLDMYLITLAFVFAMGIYFLWKENQIQISSWPFLMQLLLLWVAAIIVFRFTPFADQTLPPTLQLPEAAQVQATLDTVREQAAQASQTGQVLFMDQRQLITFGYIRDVPLVPEYEKKYMMDQALASNAKYFRQYYIDLSNKRFNLIVTEPLKLIIKKQDTGVFSDENDAWVRWVSAPTLCFYDPVFTDPDNRIQLLIPRSNTDGCAKYLSGEQP